MPILSPDMAVFAASVPIVIAGSGACGLVTLLAAHDAGGDLIVIERDSPSRGSTSTSPWRSTLVPLSTRADAG